MNPELAALLAEARRLRKQYPNTPIAKIDAWIAENAPGVRSFRELELAVSPPPGMAAAAGMNPIGALFARGQTERLSQNVGRSMLRGATLNFDDNIAGMIGAGDTGLYSPESRASFEQFRKDRPGMDAAASVIGSLPTGGLLGSAARTVLLRQAAKSAPAAVNAARVLTAQGTVPRMIQGAGAGGLTGGAAAVGDEKSAGDVALSATLGAGLGFGIPALVGAAQGARKLLSPAATSGRGIRENVELMGNMVAGPNGVPQSGAPLTARDRFLDFLNPVRVQERAQRGLDRMDVGAAAQIASGRGATMTPLDVDPTENMLLTTQTANAIRQNPKAAALQSVEDLSRRDVGAGRALRGDIVDSYAAGGVPAPLVRNPLASQGDRDVRMAMDVQNAAGTAPQAVKAATLAGAPTPAKSKWTVADRVAEIENQTTRFAQSPEGYAGLQPVIRAGSGGQGTSPEVLDQIRNGLDRAATANPAAPFRNLQQMLGMIQGGVDEATPVTIGRVQDTLRDINQMIEAATAKTPPGTLRAVNLDVNELAALKQARDVVTQYADDGFRGPQGQTFSDVSRRYAQGQADARAVQLGANLFDGAVPGEGAISAARGRQILADLSPSELQNAKQGILSRQLEKYRGANRADDTGAQLQLLRERSGGEHAQSELLRVAFPTVQGYQQALTRQIMLDAADQGVAAFTNTSAAQVRAAFAKIDPKGQDEFRRALIGSIENMSETPDLVQNFLKSAGKDLRSDSGEWMTKFQIVFGKKGAEEMRQRVLLAARGQKVEQTISAAATNTAAPEGEGVVPMMTRQNAITGEGRIQGPINRLLRTSSREATKTATAQTNTMAGPAGIANFKRTVMGATEPVQVGNASALWSPATLAYLFGSRQP